MEKSCSKHAKIIYKKRLVAECNISCHSYIQYKTAKTSGLYRRNNSCDIIEINACFLKRKYIIALFNGENTRPLFRLISNG